MNGSKAIHVRAEKIIPSGLLLIVQVPPDVPCYVFYFSPLEEGKYRIPEDVMPRTIYGTV
jgi:hypothetical protein